MEEQKHMVLITKIGLAKMTNSALLGKKVNFATMVFGDGKGDYPDLSDEQTQLVNEVYRTSINNVEVIDEATLRVLAVIPPQDGGFTVREIGILDDEGDLLAVGTYPATLKPSIESGATTDIAAVMLIRVANTENVVLKVDPTVTLATIKDLDNLRQDLEGQISSISFTDIENELKGHIDKVDNKIFEHSKLIYEDEDGRHGLRIKNGKLEYFDGYDWLIIETDPITIRDIDNIPLRVEVSDLEPSAETGRIYYNTKDNLFYVSRNNQWYRLFVGGDEKLEQEAPKSAPKLISRTDTIVELEYNEDMEFRYQGSSWQEENVFKNLQRNETYKFEQRYKGDEVYKASPPSPALSVTTDKGTQTAPNPPKVSDIDFDRVTVTGESNTEVRLNSGTWYSSPHTFTRLTEETEYTAYARKKETNTHKPSPTSTGTKFITPAEIKIYGVIINNNNANPSTRVKYIDDALGFSPVRGNNGNTDWGSWKDTFIYEKFKPCVVKNGEVQYYLDKEDKTKKLDGSPSVLTGADGDVMVEIDKMWYKIETIEDKIYVRISNAPQNGFKCLAHTRGNSEVDKIYVGAFLGYEQNGKLRSISGVEPTGNKTIGSFRSFAEANGDRYHQVPFTTLTLLQTIMTIMLKSTDTQTALGRGHVDDDSSFSKTGNTNKKGMVFGETGGQANTGQMCFMGIEDFWGNKSCWIDGLKYVGNKIKLATTNFNDDARGYETVGNYPDVIWGFIKSVKGTTETGFIPANADGSGSTYFCDRGSVSIGFPTFGGGRSYTSIGGGFCLFSSSDSHSDSSLASRLFMYGK